MDFLGIGGWEILLVLVIAFFFLGPDKIVGVARSAGKIISVLKKTTSEFTNQLNREFQEQRKNSPGDAQKVDKD